MTSAHHADRILALDLGTSCGWAFSPAHAPTMSGTWHLATKNPSVAYSMMLNWLRAEIRISRPRLLAYEAVPARAHRGGDAAHRWGGFEAVALIAAGEALVPVIGVPIQRWKKVAGVPAGSGPREALAAARARWDDVRGADEAVARFVALAAREMMSR